jgi:hypothetical protein
MEMVQLAYVSEASTELDHQQLVELVAQANRKNSARGVSGALYYGAGRFLQIVEGEQVEVMPLYARILQDDRHGRVRLLCVRPIRQRAFPEWGMAIVDGVGSDSSSLLEEGGELESGWSERDAVDLIKWFRDELAPKRAV